MQNVRALLICAAVAALFVAPSHAEELNLGAAKLIFKNGQLTLQQQSRELLRLEDIRFNYRSATSWSAAQPDADQIVLTGNFPASAYFYQRPENTADLPVQITISREPHGFRMYANPEWARQVTLEFASLGDHFFGLSEPLQPDNRLSPDLTGTSITVDVASEGESIHENYASAYSSFYMSSAGYGSFFDTFARGRYDFAINNLNRIHHDTGTLDWHVFLGSDGREIHRAYFELIGKPKPAPIWAVGPVGWRDQNDGGAAEILADVAHMNALHIPFTAWFVDRPYSDGAHGWSRMNFSPIFANPGQWIAKLRNDFGVEFMTWVTPATFGDARFPKHLAGKFTYIDLSDTPSVRAYQDELKRNQFAFGVKGSKIDRADEVFPEFEDWADTTVAPAAKRNTYTYLMAKVHDEALREVYGDDQVTFARAAIHRSQPYLTALWGGDPRANWEGLKGNFANAARTSFMGFPLWGTDVGGYQGEGFIPKALYARWLQAASMAGLFEIKLDGAGGEGRDRLPWHYDDEMQQIFRSACEDRMRFIPYLYSLSHTSAQTGTVMQPLAYRHLNDPKTFDVWDEFYVGDAILVAPVFGPETQRRVYLPAGEWRDYDNASTRFTGGKFFDIAAPIAKLPRFVRANSVYVTGNVYRGNDRLWNASAGQLTIHAFPSERGASEFIYVDPSDGDQAKPIRLSSERNAVRLTAPAMQQGASIEVVLKHAPKSISLNGAAATGNYDAAASTLTVPMPAGKNLDMNIAL